MSFNLAPIQTAPKPMFVVCNKIIGVIIQNTIVLKEDITIIHLPLPKPSTVDLADMIKGNKNNCTKTIITKNLLQIVILSALIAVEYNSLGDKNNSIPPTIAYKDIPIFIILL